MTDFASNTTNVTTPVTDAQLEGGFAGCDGASGLKMTSANFNAVLKWISERISDIESPIDTGTNSPSTPPTGLPFYIQSGVQIDGDADLEDVIWWWNGSTWIDLHDLDFTDATTSAKGIVELATNAEATNANNNSVVLTPQNMWHVLNTLACNMTSATPAEVSDLDGTEKMLICIDGDTKSVTLADIGLDPNAPSGSLDLNAANILQYWFTVAALNGPPKTVNTTHAATSFDRIVKVKGTGDDNANLSSVVTSGNAVAMSPTSGQNGPGKGGESWFIIPANQAFTMRFVNSYTGSQGDDGGTYQMSWQPV